MKFQRFLGEKIIDASDKFRAKTANDIRQSMDNATAALRGQEAVEIASEIEKPFGRKFRSPTIMSKFSRNVNPIAAIITSAYDKNVHDRVRKFANDVLRKNRDAIEKDINDLIDKFEDMKRSAQDSPSKFIYQRYINKWESYRRDFREIIK